MIIETEAQVDEIMTTIESQNVIIMETEAATGEIEMATATKGSPGETVVTLEIKVERLGTVEAETTIRTQAVTGEAVIYLQKEPRQGAIAVPVEIKAETEKTSMTVETFSEEMNIIESASGGTRMGIEGGTEMETIEGGTEMEMIEEMVVEVEELLVIRTQEAEVGGIAEATETLTRRKRRHRRRRLMDLRCRQATDLLLYHRSSRRSRRSRRRRRVHGSQSGVSSHPKASCRASLTGSKISLHLSQLTHQLEKGKGESRYLSTLFPECLAGWVLKSTRFRPSRIPVSGCIQCTRRATVMP